MTASAFDSPILQDLFPTAEVGRLFTATAEVRAMMLVLGALAKVQGAQGLIPTDSAAFIHRSAQEVQVDPAGLGAETARTGAPGAALVAAFRKALNAPDQAVYAQWGVDPQDIQDTALMLRLRQALSLIEGDLKQALTLLADQAEAQPASGTAALRRGAPLLELLAEGPELRGALWVSCSGAPDTRAQLAEALRLVDPGQDWPAGRAPVMRIAHWMAQVAQGLARLGADLMDRDRVTATALIALSHQQQGLMQSLRAANSERGEAALFTEWLCLPQIVLGAASAAHLGAALLARAAGAAESPTSETHPSPEDVARFTAQVRAL